MVEISLPFSLQLRRLQDGGAVLWQVLTSSPPTSLGVRTTGNMVHQWTSELCSVPCRGMHIIPLSCACY